MRVFFDSSAFVKRYVSETGTEAVLAWCDRASEIGLSGIALPEIVAAFCRLRREGRIDDTQYRQLKSLLLADIEDAAMCDLNPDWVQGQSGSGRTGEGRTCRSLATYGGVGRSGKAGGFQLGTGFSNA